MTIDQIETILTASSDETSNENSSPIEQAKASTTAALLGAVTTPGARQLAAAAKAKGKTKPAAKAKAPKAPKPVKKTKAEMLADLQAKGLIDGADTARALAADKPKAPSKSSKPKKEANVTTTEATEPKAPKVTKGNQLIDMLSREEGATVAEVAEAFGWLPHTTRAAISTSPKKTSFPAGKVLSSEKDAERGRVYRIVDAPASDATPAA